MQRRCRRTVGGAVALLPVVALLLTAAPAFGQAFVVKDGQPQAEIVISETPARTVKVAAAELQEYVQKISGAKLAVVTTPTEGCPAQVYVGRSAHTDRLKVTGEDLEHGGFRMVSGANWLALIGNDRDYAPPEFMAKAHGGEDALKRWDAITGTKWGNPFEMLFRGYDEKSKLWMYDGRGSINAVYEFLRGLGVRWYFPGEIGEVVPAAKSIALPQMNRTVRPDFAVRYLCQYYVEFLFGRQDEIKWQLRLGLNPGQECLGIGLGHGICQVHRRVETHQAHPEYFALWNGKRALDHMGGQGAPCLSSEGLFHENVKYARMLFDKFNEPEVDVSPADGYTALCQCDLCKGKGTPERGWNGQLSDYVWGYVNRVATELYKTHPDRKVRCLAYTAYQQPPAKIGKLSPNVAVILCRWRGDFYNAQTRDQFTKLTQDWMEKLPSKTLYVWDYYLHSRPGGPTEGVPVYFPHIISEDLRFLKGKSRGEFVEVARNWPAWKIPWHALASNHLNVYVTSRLYWDAGQDVDAMLAEYYTLFYGPAAGEMRAFVEYAEANWPKATKDVKVIDRLAEMLKAARAKAGDGVYGKRIDLLTDFMKPLLQKRDQLAKGRDGAPKARAYTRDQPPKLDGDLDKPFWQGVAEYGLSELETGRPPAYGTTFKSAWVNGSLYFGIRCQDAENGKLNVGSEKNEDTNIFNGDNIELLIETQTHAYYQIVVSPSGAVIDLDRKNGIDSLWSSQVEVAVRRGKGFWTLEVRLPVAGESQESLDARNGVSGRMPSPTYPWYFNLCRQRVRDNGVELSAFSATGKRSFHEAMKFGELYVH